MESLKMISHYNTYGYLFFWMRGPFFIFCRSKPCCQNCFCSHRTKNL